MINIYKNVPRSKMEDAGYFKPVEPASNISDRFKFNIPWRGQIVFYPGSFGQFHDGHLSVIKRIEQDYPGALIVISPANSDYSVTKYGAWSTRSSNKMRYDAISKAMKEHCFSPWVIDINSMLNSRCDQNITDSLQMFLEHTDIDLKEIPQPIIVSGKDKDWTILNDHQDIVKVVYYPDVTGRSTSDTVAPLRNLKTLILRVNTVAEWILFKDTFQDQYTEIKPYWLSVELDTAMRMAPHYTHTICKEYSDFLPYISLSRHFINPLEDPFHVNDGNISSDMVILDSDIYSGGTKKHVENCGAKLGAVINLEGFTDKYELLDISDFYKDEFRYPFVDISSRCSMQAFDVAFHNRYDAFMQRLRSM